MPFVCSPDSFYIMDSSFQLLEMTADIHPAAFYSGFNLDHFFDTYDAHYQFETASPAISILNSLMQDWTDKRNDSERGLILSNNIYNSASQLDELSVGITNKLIQSYLKNNNIEQSRNLFYFDEEEEDTLNIRTENDIIVPANIGSAIINSKRYYDYVMNFKNQLKKSFDSDLSLKSTRQAHILLSNQRINGINLSDEFVNNQNKENYIKDFNARKTLKKGIKKFSNLFGNSKIKSFISGDGFTVNGSKYNWHFSQRKHVSILSMTHSPLSGHIPYVLTLMTKDNLEIANCCVYVSNNTPIIDQIITIMLYIQHDESELLENCNFFNKRDDQEEVVTERTINRSLINDTSIGLSLSEYDIVSNRLNDKFRPLVKEKLSKVIGIENNFFNFLCNQKENPITVDTNTPLFTDNFTNFKNLILN